MTNIDKQHMTQCRKCNKVFHQNELTKIHKKLYKIDITEKVCPECGGVCGLMDYPWDEYFLIHKSKKFFNRKHNKHNMKLLDECYYIDEMGYGDWDDYY